MAHLRCSPQCLVRHRGKGEWGLMEEESEGLSFGSLDIYTFIICRRPNFERLDYFTVSILPFGPVSLEAAFSAALAASGVAVVFPSRDLITSAT